MWNINKTYIEYRGYHVIFKRKKPPNFQQIDKPGLIVLDMEPFLSWDIILNTKLRSW